ncbi:Trk system potassium uptake protein TrkG [Posidoniimonas corsicana]|uniref:Trk system potassium uptake protein TrkG n=1 Tax=Posidoniimonas corsicana TaxID=1938618 RepID=A0A5C5VIX0_9BACT|nr:TrkH family potassium uptake protein [Posidoniimonas corsicana]TWT37839.1 Trk system potassium uptake protein TrkG [Posidoniimonas corsicana]
MNYPIVMRLLGMVSWLIGATMLGSVPWAFPWFGQAEHVEWQGLIALAGSMAACGAIGAVLRYLGRGAQISIYRREAMAVVGLSWVLATVLGALPYLFSQSAVAWEEYDTGLRKTMTIADCLFESQSGFSTTGATVLTDIEDPLLLPRSILFWRCSTHFLGGLGIIVLFVAVLGQGSAGKALMRAEIPGPSKEGAQERMQHTAWTFAGIYCVLNLVLAVVLHLESMSWFDAICHAFGTMATGGFSTYNASLGHFNSAVIDYTVLVFMVIAGMNFTLIYLVSIGRGIQMLKDIEWRIYMTIIVAGSLVLGAISVWMYEDFDPNSNLRDAEEVVAAARYVPFTFVSILTTTGYGTHDFDRWNQFGRAVLFLLMFVGGCAGSTGGGMKVIRHVLFVKILRLEIEHSYHPNVVRHLRLGGVAIPDPELRRTILLYFGLVTFIFMLSWLMLVGLEPDSTWSEHNQPLQNKLIDSASAVAATLNNIGPGLGTVGATQNYEAFSSFAKLLFVLLMMLGRLELFPVLVMGTPAFWRKH